MLLISLTGHVSQQMLSLQRRLPDGVLAFAASHDKKPNSPFMLLGAETRFPRTSLRLLCSQEMNAHQTRLYFPGTLGSYMAKGADSEALMKVICSMNGNRSALL